MECLHREIRLAVCVCVCVPLFFFPYFYFYSFYFIVAFCILMKHAYCEHEESSVDSRLCTQYYVIGRGFIFIRVNINKNRRVNLKTNRPRLERKCALQKKRSESFAIKGIFFRQLGCFCQFLHFNGI